MTTSSRHRQHRSLVKRPKAYNSLHLPASLPPLILVGIGPLIAPFAAPQDDGAALDLGSSLLRPVVALMLSGRQVDEGIKSL